MKLTPTLSLLPVSASALLLALAAPAAAGTGDHDGLGIGARVETGLAGIGADYWSGPLGVTASIGGFASNYGYAEQIDESPGVDTDDDWTEIGASVGALYSLVSSERTRLAVGGRVGYRRSNGTFFGGLGESGYDWWVVQLPIRIQVWIAPHVAIHTELGLEASFLDWRSDVVDDQGPIGEQRQTGQTFDLFGHPLGNLGVTYTF